jgi:hypothetical protein
MFYYVSHKKNIRYARWMMRERANKFQVKWNKLIKEVKECVNFLMLPNCWFESPIKARIPCVILVFSPQLRSAVQTKRHVRLSISIRPLMIRCISAFCIITNLPMSDPTRRTASHVSLYCAQDVDCICDANSEQLHFPYLRLRCTFCSKSVKAYMNCGCRSVTEAIASK